MAARKPRTLTAEDVFKDVTPPPPAQNFPVVPPAVEDDYEEDEVTALNNILSEIGGLSTGAGYVNVYREDTLPNGKTERLYMGQMSASDFVNGGFVESLKQQYGPGKFDLCVYVPGHRGVYARKKIPIAGDKAVAAPGGLSGAGTHEIVAAINRGNEQTLQAILALAQQKPQQPDMMGQLQMFKMMKDIFSPGTAAPSAGPLDALAAIKLGAELAGRGGNIDDSDSGWASKMIDTFGKPIVDLVMGGAAGSPVNPATPPFGGMPRLPNPAAPVTPATVPAGQPANTENSDVTPMISFYLNMLKSKAVKNEPVEPVADDILSRLSPPEAGELCAILKPDNWRDTMRRHTAAIDAYPEWFGRLRDTILKYNAEDTADSIPGIAGGLTVIPATGISVAHDSQPVPKAGPETP